MRPTQGWHGGRWLASSADDYDLYKITRPSGCGERFQVVLQGWDEGTNAGHDVDLFVRQGFSTTTLPSSYTEQNTSTQTWHAYTNTSAPAGTEWSVLVKHKPNTPATYALYYDSGCSGSDGGTRCENLRERAGDPGLLVDCPDDDTSIQ